MSASSAPSTGYHDDPPPPYTPYAQSPNPNLLSSHVPQNNGGYGTTRTTTVIFTPQPPADTIILVGGCPVCRIGVLEEEFTWLGILCCLLFFPLGLLPCLLLRQRRCLNCGAVF